jgi:hypothetical protein
MSLTLPRDELNELVGLAPTSRATPERVQQLLCEMGIPFRTVSGRVLVSRAAAEDWLRGHAVAKSVGGVHLERVR